jgi:hypothetical protein
MAQQHWWVPILIVLVIGCTGCHNDAFLDSSIPRVVTFPEQIATVRTKWLDGKLQQTTFLDKQDRVLEDFLYGRTNEKIWNEYTDDKKSSSTHYYHSDSEPSGYVHLLKSKYDYDQIGHVTHIHKKDADIGIMQSERVTLSRDVYYVYKNSGDTLLIQIPKPGLNSSTVIDSIRWERNNQGQLARNLRLYVMKMPQES